VKQGPGLLAPAWYGQCYPTFEDLEVFTWNLGAVVVPGPVSAGAYFPGSDWELPVIAIPEDAPPLERIWTLAHELGHLVQHAGPKGELMWSKNEAQANRWAACALIPEARIQAYQNASLDAFVGALSAHYEDLPLTSCAARRLAGRIARLRLKSMEATCIGAV
jgi:hypothetical protein